MNSKYDEDNILENDDLETSLYDDEGMLHDDFRSIRVTKKDFSLYEMFRKFQAGKLVLDVDFQRRRVWTDMQNIELIESILMGLPLPIFYFKQQEQASYITVDGKQRLSAVFDFMMDQFSLEKLTIMRHLNGKKFSTLTDEYGIYQSQLEDYQIYAHVILPPTPDRILFNIFDRVNRGGTKLNKQEIRNSLYHGPALEKINDITESEIFINATGIEPKRDKRMKGSYLLTRFFAFLLLREGKIFSDKERYVYRGDVDDLLANSLQQLNQSGNRDLEELSDIALSCLERASIAFGKGAFRKNGISSNPINMNIFETTLYFIYKLEQHKIDLTVDVRTAYEVVCDSEQYLRFINRGGSAPEYVKGRFDLMDELVEKFMR